MKRQLGDNDSSNEVERYVLDLIMYNSSRIRRHLDLNANDAYIVDQNGEANHMDLDNQVMKEDPMEVKENLNDQPLLPIPNVLNTNQDMDDISVDSDETYTYNDNSSDVYSDSEEENQGPLRLFVEDDDSSMECIPFMAHAYSSSVRSARYVITRQMFEEANGSLDEYFGSLLKISQEKVFCPLSLKSSDGVDIQYTEEYKYRLPVIVEFFPGCFMADGSTPLKKEILRYTDAGTSSVSCYNNPELTSNMVVVFTPNREPMFTKPMWIGDGGGNWLVDRIDRICYGFALSFVGAFDPTKTKRLLVID